MALPVQEVSILPAMIGRILAVVVIAGWLGLLSGCTSCGKEQTPEQIREETANATAKLKRDTVAVAQGVKDGVTRPKTVDINAASKTDLTSLPGVSGPVADRIINGRPYENTDQLVTKRVVTPDEYDKIKDRVAVKK
jgi:DNA uptake protein ComE-like DNA-binding protein